MARESKPQREAEKDARKDARQEEKEARKETKPAEGGETVPADAVAVVEPERHGSELGAVPVAEVEEEAGVPDGMKAARMASFENKSVTEPDASADATLEPSEAPAPRGGQAHAGRDGGRGEQRENETRKTLAINALADARSGEDYGVSSRATHLRSGYSLPAEYYEPAPEASVGDTTRGVPKNMLPDDPEQANKGVRELRAEQQKGR